VDGFSCVFTKGAGGDWRGSNGAGAEERA